MAMATTTAIMLALAAASAGTAYYNTKQTASRQDSALSQQIHNQSKKQKDADAKVNDEVAKLKDSDAASERAQSLQNYMTALVKKRNGLEAGLAPDVGGAAFQKDSAAAAQGVQNYGATTAGLMSRIDAPTMQRQGEGFDYGNLATDLQLIGRDAAGQNFLDQLRLSRIRRNPGLDAASSFMGGMAGAMGSGGAAGATTASGSTGTIPASFFANGGLAGIGY